MIIVIRHAFMTHELIGFLIDKNHPLRSALVDEMHVRRFPDFRAPMRMTQLVMLTGEQNLDAARSPAVELCLQFSAVPPAGRYFSVRIGPFQFVWEHHTEFSTYSFIKPGHFDDPFGEPVLLELPH